MRNQKRFLTFLLACVTALSLSVPAFAAVEDTGFPDVAAGVWYAEAAGYVRDNGVMNGTSATTFGPDLTMTRSMLATVLYRAAGSPAVTGADSFTDTEDGAYYADAVVWASTNGIVSGYGNGLFGTNDPVSREQIATILWRYDGSETGAASAGFTDSAAIGSYAVEAVNWAVDQGIVTGLSDGSFSPKGNATRAQVAVMLHRYLTRDTSSQSPVETPDTDSRTLIAYFSRAGENWEVGVVEKGNTQIIAEMIADWTGGELFHIETAEPYPEDYMETVRQAQAEQDANIRPELAANVDNWDDYDTVFLGYPIWGGDMPMAVYTFIESYDWAGKTVVPFNTHGGSGQSGTVSSIRSACAGAEVQSGIAITGTTAQNDRENAKRTVEQWLEGMGFDDVRAQQPLAPTTAPDAPSAGSTDITLSFGGTAVSATLDNSATSRAFLDTLPRTLTMARYGDREYYAAIDTLPEGGEAIPDFENGDVTYYAAGGSLAIFFGNADSSSQSGLIRMGRITSSLAVFDNMADSVEVTISRAGDESSAEQQVAAAYRARCDAMVRGDTDALDRLLSDDLILRHITGATQTKDEWLADVAAERMKYYDIDIQGCTVTVDGDRATCRHTSVIDARINGSRGTWTLTGTSYYKNQGGQWIAVNEPEA